MDIENGFQIEFLIRADPWLIINSIDTMATAGYSGTPLLKKLGLKEGFRIRLIHPPDDYFQWLDADLSAQLCSPGELPDWVHLFAASRQVFEKGMQPLKAVCQKNPPLVIWVSWYKKSSAHWTRGDRTSNFRTFAAGGS